MRKLVVLLLGLALVLVGSSVVFAEGIKVDGSYLFGTTKMGDGVIEGNAGGFVLSGEGAISGPFGAAANLAFLKGTDLKWGSVPCYDISVTRMDFLGTYAVPLEGASIKAVAGYSTATSKDDVSGGGEVKFSGFLLGAAGEYSPMDKLVLSGTFGFGVGLKAESGGVSEDAGLTTYKFAAAYEVADNVSVEAGYMSDSYTVTDVDFLAQSGFFVGAKASF